MAWDNPHGTLSADERLRLEREAQIFAEAQRKMLREEQKRAERDAERSQPISTSTSHYAYPRTVGEIPPLVRVKPSPTIGEILAQKQAAEEKYQEKLAKIRARVVLESAYGSAKYIQHRYGQPAWTSAIAEYRKKYKCTEEEAIQLICRNYKEEEWRELESELVEKLLGNRPE